MNSIKIKAPPGRWISFEGIDGCGKSTLVAGFQGRLRGRGLDPLIAREPGGTLLGEDLRRLLLTPGRESMDPWTELLLYTASRVHQLRQVVQPALADGRWVLSDRYADATLAYQGYGRGLPLELIRTLHDWAAAGAWPELTVLIDCAPETALGRCRGRHCRGLNPTQGDRLEAESTAFFARVRGGYLALAEQEPGRFLVLDGEQSADRLLRECWQQLGMRLGLEAN